MFQQILVQPPWMKNQHRTLFAAQPGLVLKNKLAHIVEAALVESIESRALDAVFDRPLRIHRVAVEQAITGSHILQPLEKVRRHNRVSFEVSGIPPGDGAELRLNLQFHFFQDDGILFSGAYFAAGTEFAAGLYQGRNTGRIGQWSAYADIGVLAHLDAGVLY